MSQFIDDTILPTPDRPYQQGVTTINQFCDDTIPPTPERPDDDTEMCDLSVGDSFLGFPPWYHSSEGALEVQLAVNAAQQRTAQRYESACQQSANTLDAEEYCANETAYTWGKPSRAEIATIGWRYLAKVAAANGRHSARVDVARAIRAETERQLIAVLHSYESAVDREAVVQFVVEFLNAL